MKSRKGVKFLGTKSKVDDFRGYNSDNINVINYFDSGRFNNFVTDFSNTSLYHGGLKRPKAVEKYKSTEEANKQIYGRLSSNGFFDDITNLSNLTKSQSSTKFFDNVIKINEENNIVTNRSNKTANLINYNKLYNSIKKTDDIIRNGGHIISFDIEALSGINQYGQDVISHITELSATVHKTDAVKKQMTKLKTVDTVLGFNSKEAKESREFIETMFSKSKNDWSNEEKVFFERMNIYANTKIKDFGFEQRVVEAKGIEDIVTSKAQALKGIDILEGVGKKQQAWMKSNKIDMDYVGYKKNYIENFVNLLSSGKYGKNSYDNFIVTGHNINGYDIEKMLRFTDGKYDIDYFDTLQFANYSQENLGRSSIYHKDAIRPKGFGPATQYSLTDAHNIKVKGAAAHIARNDQEEAARLLVQGMFKDTASLEKEVNSGVIEISDNSYFNQVIKKNIQNIDKKMRGTSSVYKGKDQIYYMDFTGQKSFFNTDSSLSFVYDPISKKYKTFDGYNIARGKSGEVEKAGFNAFGAKNGGLYQHNLYSIDVNSKNFKDQFMNITGVDERQANKFFQQYSNAKNLYVVQSKEYMDIEALEKKLGSKEAAEFYYNNRNTIFTIETNKDRLGANLGVNVAEIKDGKVIKNKDAIKSLGFRKTYGETGNVKVQNTGLDSNVIFDWLVDKSADRTIGDSAARKVRESSYVKTVQMRNYQKLIKQSMGSDNISNPITLRVSELISQGKAIDLTTNDEIITALGWTDIATKDKKIVSETIKNSVALDSYYEKLAPLFDSIETVLDEAYGKLDISTPEKLAAIRKNSATREVLYKKELGFKQLVNSFIDSSGVGASASKSFKDGLHTRRDLNKVDFNSFDINPERFMKTIGATVGNEASEIVSIDLNKPNSMIDLFFKSKFNKVEDVVAKDSNAGFDALKEAYNFLRADERFLDGNGRPLLFNNINLSDPKVLREYQKSNVSQLADDMMKDFRKVVGQKRYQNESFGYLNPRMTQDVFDYRDLANIVSSKGNGILNEIRDLKKTLPKDFKLIPSSMERSVEDLVDNYFLQFDIKDLDLKGLTNQQRSYVKEQYELAKRVSKAKAQDLLTAISGTNVQLGITNTNNGNVLSLFEGDTVTHLDNMFKFSHNKGMITTAIGDNEYALRMGFGRVAENGEKVKDIFRLTNNIEKIASSNRDSLNAEWAVRAGKTVSEGIAENTKNIAKAAMESTARIELANGQLFAQSFAFDINEIMYALPELVDSDVFNLAKIEEKYGIDENARKAIRSLIGEIENNRYKFRNNAFNSTIPTNVNYFTSYYMAPLIDEIRNNEGMFTASQREVLSGLSFDNKNRQMWRGQISGTNNLYLDPLAKMDDDKRPPVTQMANARLYEKDEVLQKLEELKKTKPKAYRDLKAGPIYTSDIAEKYLYSNTTADGKQLTSGLSMKYLQVDTYSLQNVIDADVSSESSRMKSFINKEFGNYENIKSIQDKIIDRAKKMSTYEQQSSMDARVHDVAFYKTNTQTINAKKKLISDHMENLEVINDLDKKKDKLYFTIDDNGNIKYEIGIGVKKNDILGRYGTEEFNELKFAKYDGIFRGRYFDDAGNVVSENRLNNIIKNSNVNKNNKEEILKLLDSNFAFKYEVLGLEEDHGVKVMLGASEKTTVESMKLAIGDIDKNLANTLKQHGFDDVVGKVVRKDYLDEVLYKQLEEKGLNAREIMDAILKERYAFSDALFEIDAFKGKSFITALDADKHSSATLAMHNFLNTLQDRGQINNENMEEVFGKGNFRIIGEGKDARVLIEPSLDKVNLNFEKGSDLYKALNDSTAIDASGDIVSRETIEAFKEMGLKSPAIGYTGQANIITMMDDSAGTSAGAPKNIASMKEELQLIDKELEDAPDTLRELLLNKREKLQREYEKASSLQGKEKGVKFSEAMGKTLDRQTYNEDGLNLVYKHFRDTGNKEEFFNVFGHALDLENMTEETVRFNDNYRGRSVTAPITDRFRSQLIKKDGERTLAEVAKDPLDYKFKNIIQSVVEEGNGNLDEITTGAAENMYSYLRGTEAMRINAAGEGTVNALVEKAITAPEYKNFKVVDFSVDSPEWLDLQIGGQGNTVTTATNNPYTNNIIIKTGLGGSEEYLAIPRMPEIHAGDSLVTSKHVSSLRSLQDKFMTLKGSGTNAEYEETAGHIRNQIKRIKDQQVADITGKEGLIKKLTEIRVDQSFMGKASGAVMVGIDENNNNLFGSGNVEALDRLNSEIFRTAKFNGKTLNEHYASGAVIDSIQMSEKVFEKMGYFDEDFLNKTFNSISDDYASILKEKGFETQTLDDKRETMKYLLSTEGDAFIGVRYPEIMPGSDTVNMGYLDASLKGNEIRVTGPSGMKAKLDFDGDQFNALRIKTSTGESRLNAIIGDNISDELKELRQATDASITIAATTDNKYWEYNVQKFMTGKKGYETFSEGMNIERIARNKTINGVSYVGSMNKSEHEYVQLFNKYNEAGLLGEYDSDDDLIKAVEDFGGTLDDYVAAKSYADRNDMIVAKVYQNAVGETNVTNQRIKSIVSGLLDKESSNYEYKSSLMYDFLYQSEEAAISSKSSIEGLTPERARTWNKSVTNFITGKGDRDAERGVMKDWLDKNISDSLTAGLYFSKSDSFNKMVGEKYNVHTLNELDDLLKSSRGGELKATIIDDIINTIDEVSNRDDIEKVYNSLKIATAQGRVNARVAQNLYMIEGQESNLKTAMKGMQEFFGENLLTEVDQFNEANSTSNFLKGIDTIISGDDVTDSVSTKGKIEGIMEGIGNFAKSLPKGSLAKGALGLAAGVMVAGFVGGRPRPASTHAMEEAEDTAPMDGYGLADAPIVQGGSQNGYVININAKTNKGRDNAVQALQQAISSGSNGSINIAMNITDNYGNINDRAIENAIMGAF